MSKDKKKPEKCNLCGRFLEKAMYPVGRCIECFLKDCDFLCWEPKTSCNPAQDGRGEVL